MHPIIIIQARMGSTRLPGKVLAPLENQPLLDWVLSRCSLSRKAAGIVLATSNLPADDPLEVLAKRWHVPVFRGSESDVLARYLEAAALVSADPIIRITGDCPLIDPGIIDQALATYAAAPVDYLFIEGYPNGLGAAEVMAFAALKRAWAATSPGDSFYREHVMTYLTDHPEAFSLHLEQAPAELVWPQLRLCVDEPADLEVVRLVCRHFAPRRDFGAAEIIPWLRTRSDIVAINAAVQQKTQ